MHKRHRSSLRLLIKPLAILAALAVLGCRGDLALTPPEAAPASGPALAEDALATNRFAWVGDEHNAALDYLLLELGRIRALNRLPDPAIANLIESGTRRFMLSRGIDVHSDILRRGLSSVPRSDAFMPAATSMAETGELSWDAAQYLEQIQLWVEDTAIPVTDLRTRLQALQEEAYERLDATESELVLSVAAVAYSSTTYWEENGDAWAEWYVERQLAEPLSNRPGQLEDTDDISIMGRINWRRVAGHDVLGAISGGTAAAVTGAGIAAGAAGGAAGASTLSALGQLVLGW